MVGYVQESIAYALKRWDALKDANVMPVRSVDGASVVVNTPLPCIVIHINGTEGEGNTYFGGGIRQYFDLELWYICDVPNYTFSKDDFIQAKKLDLSDDIIRCMELTKDLDELKVRHDFNWQFDRMETESTYGTKGSLAVTVDVHKIIYKCDVEFDLKDEAYNRYVTLKRVEIDNNGINKSVIE